LDSGSGYENAVTSRVVSKNEGNCVTSSDTISFTRGTLILVLSLLKSSASGSETRQVLVRAQQEPSYNMAWYSTAWYGTAWYSTAWYGTAWYSTAYTVQHGTVQHGTVQHGTVQHGTVQHVQYSMVQYSMVQYSMVQDSMYSTMTTS